MPRILRILENFPNPSAPNPEHLLLLKEIRRALPLLLREARTQLRTLAALEVPDKGALELYLHDAGVLRKDLFVVLLLKLNEEPMKNNYVRQARLQALKTYPCTFTGPGACPGVPATAELPPCAHAVGRKLYQDFRRSCFASFSEEDRKLFDNVALAFEALKGMKQ